MQSAGQYPNVTLNRVGILDSSLLTIESDFTPTDESDSILRVYTAVLLQDINQAEGMATFSAGEKFHHAPDV